MYTMYYNRGVRLKLLSLPPSHHHNKILVVLFFTVN